MSETPRDARSRAHRVSTEAKILLFSSFLAAVGGSLFFGAGLHHVAAPNGWHMPWWLLAIMFHLTEVHVVHVQFRRDSESFSLSEIPLVLGMFFASPTTIVGAQVLGALTALVLRRRQPAVKVAFNLAHLTLDSVIGLAIFHAIAHPAGLISAGEVLGAFAGTGAAIVVGVLSVVSVISIAEGGRAVRMLPRVLALGVIGTVTNASLALAGVATIRTQAATAWLLLVPATTIIFSYRAYSSQRRQHQSLERFNEATRAIQRSREIEPAMLALLEHARTMFHAEVSVITLLPVGDRPALRTTLGPGDLADTMEPVTLDPTEGVWARVCSENQGVLLPRPMRPERVREHYAARGIRDAMVVPLHGEGKVIGVMLVGNRLGDVSTFTAEDLKLFEALAGHASLSLENARLVSELQSSLVRLTELNRMKDDFVATVSHELRTPLTSIAGSVKTILRLDGSAPDQERQFLEAIDRQSDRLRMLIEDLLLVSKIESQPLLPLPATVPVGALVDSVIEPYLARLANRSLEVEISANLPAAFTDEESLHRILSNLVDNAIKYSPEASPILVGARQEENSIVLWVEDHGYGVDPDKRDAIFDRFYQADQSSTRRVGGAGLGLYICRRLSERIGAQLWLDSSAPGEGSRFCVRVPCAAGNVTEIRAHRTA